MNSGEERTAAAVYSQGPGPGVPRDEPEKEATEEDCRQGTPTQEEELDPEVVSAEQDDPILCIDQALSQGAPARGVPDSHLMKMMKMKKMKI